jgi:hypothetical protein
MSRDKSKRIPNKKTTSANKDTDTKMLRSESAKTRNRSRSAKGDGDKQGHSSTEANTKQTNGID